MRNFKYPFTALVLTIIALMLSLATQRTEAQILGTDWIGTFYNSTDLTGVPIATGVMYPTGLCFNWGNGVPTSGGNAGCAQPGAPIPGANSDNVSASFLSSQNFAAAGNYVFTLRYNDGIRFYIDGAVVFDDFAQQNQSDTVGTCANLCRERQFTQNLTAGTHTLRVDYVEYVSNAILQVQWGGPFAVTATPTATHTPTIALTLQTPTSTPEAELIDNGGFEGAFVGDFTGDLLPWKVKRGTAENIKCNRPDKQIASSGDCAFRFKGGVEENSKLQQNVDLTERVFEPGEGVSFSAQVNAKKANVDANIKIVVKYSDNTAASKASEPIVQTTNYQPVTAQVPLDSTSVSKIKVQIGHKSPNGKVLVDDVSLLIQVLATATPEVTSTPQPTNTLQPTATLEATATIEPPTATLEPTGTIEPPTATITPTSDVTATETLTATVEITNTEQGPSLTPSIEASAGPSATFTETPMVNTTATPTETPAPGLIPLP